MSAIKVDESYRLRNCRSCGDEALTVVLSLGLQPIANALLTSEELDNSESVYPLEVMACEACGLAQVSETIPPEILFNDEYPYFSSFIPALLAHSEKHVQALMDELKPGSDDLVIEVASNDGYLLRNFVAAGVPVLGIDPASGPANVAIGAGIPTEICFFGRKSAERIAADGRRATIMLANNVLAHVADINDFVSGFAILLADTGIAEFEFPYVRDLVERCAFDTIYHEHVYYHSLTALQPLFERHGLYLNDVERLDIHGGSLRLRVSKNEGVSARLAKLQADEEALGIGKIEYYRDFGQRVSKIRDELRKTLEGYQADGKTIAAYGAAAKGATLLNFAELPEGTISFVVDRNTHKVGKFIPGVKLPIVDVQTLQDKQPDYLLILAWNFADEIVEQQRGYFEAGGTFLSAIPSPHIIEPLLSVRPSDVSSEGVRAAG